MTIDYQSFLTHDDLSNYEDTAKFETFKQPLAEYRQRLDSAIESKLDLPSFEKRKKEQFNPLDYLYKNNLLNSKELEITELQVIDLAPLIANGTYSSVEVFKAYSHRASIAHQLTNCYLEIFFDEGLKRAEYLDNYLKLNGKVVGPLHGIPVSLKEHMSYKGKITHAGYVSLINNLTNTSALTVKILFNLGATFYVRSNQPQTLMHLCSNNNFIGTCSNPYNSSLSAGGSSSGEGASVGFGGSAIGVGSDIGGSIRAPAAYSGVFGLRPTTKRISVLGGISGGPGQESVPGVIGPLARSVPDINYWMENYLNIGKPWENDATIIRAPWRKVDIPNIKDLKIAFIFDDEIVHPTPPITRGLNHVKTELEAAGATIVEWKPLKTKLAFETVHKMYTCDGNNSQRKLLNDSGEPLKKLTKWSLNYGDAKSYSVSQNRELNSIRDSLKQEYLEFMNENNIDFIISPAYNNVAPKLEEVYNWSYTSLWNILDFPTLVFQTGLFVDSEKDQWSEEHLQNFKFRSNLEELELEDYSPERYQNAPIGLQITGRRFNDEEVVAAGTAVVDTIKVSIFKK